MRTVGNGTNRAQESKEYDYKNIRDPAASRLSKGRIEVMLWNVKGLTSITKQSPEDIMGDHYIIILIETFLGIHQCRWILRHT